MSDLNEIFARITKAKKERKEIKTTYEDALRNSKPYQDVVEELKRLKDKKLSLESSIKADFQQEISKLDAIKQDIETDKQLMTDLALTKLMKGETVEIKDEYDNAYEPVFSVSFKKS